MDHAYRYLLHAQAITVRGRFLTSNSTSGEWTFRTDSIVGISYFPDDDESLNVSELVFHSGERFLVEPADPYLAERLLLQ